MTAPTTLREEIRQLLSAESAPLTRHEIFEKCTLCDDEVTLSTVLSQLVANGSITKAGMRERDKGAPLATYTRPVVLERPSATPATKPLKPRRAPAPVRSKAPPKPRKSIARVSRKPVAAAPPAAHRWALTSDGALVLMGPGIEIPRAAALALTEFIAALNGEGHA